MTTVLPSGDLVIHGVCLGHQDPDQRTQMYDITCRASRVISISSSKHVNERPSILIPAFTHSHVHLDKCFIMDRTSLVNGDFKEALDVTAKAKEKFPENLDDLFARGERLIRESVQCGVTSIRAHVEIDANVDLACLKTGLKLKEHCNDICDVQIAAFAQDPIFTEQGELNGNFQPLEQATSMPGITVIGSAPYVEKSDELAKRNISTVLDMAQKHSLLVDFHLDYNLDSDKEPLIFEVITQLKTRSWANLKTHAGLPLAVTIGHATRLSLFSPEEWRTLKFAMEGLPIHFVGLPQSDLYMMGRQPSGPLFAPRGTLNTLQLKNEHGIDAAMSINNLQNAFTPQGSADPLTLCTLGVAIFQSATPQDCRTLLRAVTTSATAALGRDTDPTDLVPKVGDRADFVVLHGSQTVDEIVLNPPFERTTIKDGKVVANRKADIWTLPYN